MSEHITHTVVLDDCARLAPHSDKICDAFKLCLAKHHDIARLGSVTRSGDRFTVKLLRDARERWPTRKEGDLVAEKLAFVLGWRCHLAGDRQFKPIYRRLDPERYAGEEVKGAGDVSIYHDVVIFREVYDYGRKEPYVPSSLDYRLESHPAASAVSIGETQKLLRAMWQRSLLEIQSFLAADDDLDKWLEIFFARYEPFEVDLLRYAEFFHNPDPDKMRRFIIDDNFYDRTDPIIALARSIQRGAIDKTINLDRAVEAAATQSQYAQALRRGFHYLHAASDFFMGKIGEDELKKRSDLGKPHVPVKPST